MKLEKREDNGILIVVASGRLDGENPNIFKQQLHKWIEHNPNLILDCSELSYIDSTGLGALLSCLRKAVAKGGDMRLSALLPAVFMVFELTRVETVFRIYDSLAQALLSYEASLARKEESPGAG